MRRFYFLTGVLTISISLAMAQKTVVVFEIALKGKDIGKVVATEDQKGTDIVREVKSESNATVMILSVHVETDSKVKVNSEVLLEGAAYRHSNHGPKDIHAATKRIAPGKYERDRNGKKTIFDAEEITFCVADLFFIEPVDRQRIYSNMFADMLPLKNLGNGKYQVTNSEGKTSTYTYVDGKLMMVESQTPAGLVMTKRVSK